MHKRETKEESEHEYVATSSCAEHINKPRHMLASAEIVQCPAAAYACEDAIYRMQRGCAATYLARDGWRSSLRVPMQGDCRWLLPGMLQPLPCDTFLSSSLAVGHIDRRHGKSYPAQGLPTSVSSIKL